MNPSPVSDSLSSDARRIGAARGVALLAAGILKCGQDLGLWLVFRHVRLPMDEAPHPKGSG